MAGVDMYRSGRERLVELCRPLTAEQAAMVVPATPEWTVLDNVAHMAGAADDILNGRLDGVATDAWTEAQVSARRGRSMDELLDELEAHGPAMDSLLEQLGTAMDPRLFIDQWTHEQDVRGALGVPGGLDVEVVGWGARIAVRGWVRSIPRAGLAPITIHCAGQVSATGDDPVGSLTVDPFTAMRVMTGRRSAAQLAALDWQGVEDPSAYFDALVVFSIPDADVHDALP